MRHEEWHAVAELPGARIVRRFTPIGFEFLDEHGARLAALDNGVLSTATQTYTFSTAGLEHGSSHEVIIPWPVRPRAREIMKSGPAPYRIDVPHGPALGFWIRSELWSLTWNVGKIVNDGGVRLITLRWTPESRTLLDDFGSRRKRRLKRLGEAVIAPHVTLPTEPILLTAYAFQLFDALSTGGT